MLEQYPPGADESSRPCRKSPTRSVSSGKFLRGLVDDFDEATVVQRPARWPPCTRSWPTRPSCTVSSRRCVARGSCSSTCGGSRRSTSRRRCGGRLKWWSAHPVQVRRRSSLRATLGGASPSTGHGGRSHDGAGPRVELPSRQRAFRWWSMWRWGSQLRRSTPRPRSVGAWGRLADPAVQVVLAPRFLAPRLRPATWLTRVARYGELRRVELARAGWLTCSTSWCLPSRSRS